MNVQCRTTTPFSLFWGTCRVVRWYNERTECTDRCGNRTSMTVVVEEQAGEVTEQMTRLVGQPRRLSFPVTGGDAECARQCSRTCGGLPGRGVTMPSNPVILPVLPYPVIGR
jgi:hypothetical protein